MFQSLKVNNKLLLRARDSLLRRKSEREREV